MKFNRHTLFARFLRMFFFLYFLRRRIEFFIFFIIATGMEVIFCLLSIRKIEFRAVPTKTPLPLNPSRKSLVSSKKKTLLCSFLFPINLTEVHTPPSKENNLFFVFPLCWAGSSLSSSFFLQLVGPN